MSTPPKTPEEKIALLESKGAVPRGIGVGSKNSKRKAARALAERKKEEAYASLNMPEYTEFTQRPVVDAWRKPNHVFLVCARLGSIPQNYIERLVIWFRANMGGLLGYLPTEADLDAAKGINLMDLVPRTALMPLMTFHTPDEAKSFIEQAAEHLKTNIQTLQWYEWNVTPPYTTSGIVYAQKEVAEFMKTYTRQDRMDHEAFKERALKLREDVDRINAKKGTVTQEQLEKEARVVKQLQPRRVTAMHSLETGVESAIADDTAESNAEVDDCRQADLTTQSDFRIEITDSWRADVKNSVDPIRTLSLHFEHNNATKALYKRQIDALAARIEELDVLTEEIEDEIMVRRHAPLDGDAGEKPTVKRFIVAPNGTKYRVMLNDEVIRLEDDETEADFNLVPPPQYDEPKKKPSTSFSERYAAAVAAAGEEESSLAAQIVGGAGCEQYQGRIVDSAAMVAEHNAKVAADRAAFQAKMEAEMAQEAIDKHSREETKKAAAIAKAKAWRLQQGLPLDDEE